MQKNKIHYLTYITTAFLVILPFIKTDQSSLVDFELLPKQLAVAVLAVIILASVIKSKIDQPLINIATGGFILFLLAHLTSLNEAINPIETWATLARNLAYGALLFGLIIGIRSKKIDLNILTKGGLAFGIIVGFSALFGALKAYQAEDISNALYNISGLYVHKNYMASALLLTLPFSIYEAIKNERIFGILGKVTSIVISLDILLLRTRSVWLALIMSIVVIIAIYLIFSKDKESQKKWIKNLSIGAASFVVLLFVIVNFTSLSESIFNQSTLKHRFTYWNSSWEMIVESPVTGIGAGNWKINFPKHGLETTDRSVINGTTTITRPHNDLIWIFSELGILGFLGFVLFIKIVYWYGIKSFRMSSDNNERWLILLSLFGVVSFIMYGLFEFPIERPGHYFFFILYVSIIISTYMNFKKIKGVSIPSNVVSIAFLVLGLFSAYVISDRLGSAKSAREAVGAYPMQYRVMINSSQNAASDFYSLDDYGNPMYFYEGVGKLGEKNIKGARRALTDALDAHPYHMLSIVQLGNSYQMENKFEDALKYYDQTLSIASKNQSALIGKAQTYLKMNDAESSLDMLNRIKPNRNGDYVMVVKETLSRIMNSDTKRFVQLRKSLSGYKDKNELFERYAVYRMQKSAERKKSLK